VADSDVATHTTTGTSDFVGVVAGVRLSDGVYIWSARFGYQELREFEAEPQNSTLVFRLYRMSARGLSDSCALSGAHCRA
jgi:hypothetical protein